jgi:hypothetical protein
MATENKGPEYDKTTVLMRRISFRNCGAEWNETITEGLLIVLSKHFRK